MTERHIPPRLPEWASSGTYREAMPDVEAADGFLPAQANVSAQEANWLLGACTRGVEWTRDLPLAPRPGFTDPSAAPPQEVPINVVGTTEGVFWHDAYGLCWLLSPRGEQRQFVNEHHAIASGGSDVVFALRQDSGNDTIVVYSPTYDISDWVDGTYTAQSSVIGTSGAAVAGCGCMHTDTGDYRRGFILWRRSGASQSLVLCTYTIGTASCSRALKTSPPGCLASLGRIDYGHGVLLCSSEAELYVSDDDGTTWSSDLALTSIASWMAKGYSDVLAAWWAVTSYGHIWTCPDTSDPTNPANWTQQTVGAETTSPWGACNTTSAVCVGGTFIFGISTTGVGGDAGYTLWTPDLTEVKLLHNSDYVYDADLWLLYYSGSAEEIRLSGQLTHPPALTFAAT